MAFTFSCLEVFAQHQTDESGRNGRRSFVKNHLGINANVQMEPPAGTLLAA